MGVQLLGEFPHPDLIFIAVFVGSVRRQGLGDGKAIDIAIECGQARSRLCHGRPRGLVRLREKNAGYKGGT